MKEKKGITLIALIITVIVLLILAGTAISIAINGGDIFSKASTARNQWNSSVAAEEQKNNEVWQILNTMTSGTNPTAKPKDASKANDPILPTGNMKVYYVTWTESEEAQGTFDEIPSETEPTTAWHNYNNGEWANIKTINETTGNTAYWVWIPRYAYKVHTKPTASDNEGTPTNPEYQIAFLSGTSNIPVNPSDIPAGESILTDAQIIAAGGVSIGDWVVHPAFNYGGTPLSGIWVAKYEASNNNGAVNVVPNATQWTSISVANAFTNCQNMKNTGGALYGTNTINADPHLMKNIEWGAVAYLTQSKYGQMRQGGNGQVYVNNLGQQSGWTYNPTKTGYAGATADANCVTSSENTYNTANGVKSTTTGNIYGIYDMSGGAWEYVAAYLATADAAENGDVATLINASDKYVDRYSIGASDTQQANYNALYDDTYNIIKKYGDAVYETSYSSTPNYSYQKDKAYFPHTFRPVFNRGGGCGDTYEAGIFSYASDAGNGASFTGFRPVFVAL